MAYKDEQGGHDNQSTRDGLNHYSESETTSEQSAEQTTEEALEKHGVKTKKGTSSRSTETEAGQAGGGSSKGGILSRLRRAMFGDKGVGEKAKSGWMSWLTGGRGLPRALLSKLASPRFLALLVAGSGLGMFSIFGIFNTYKNDDIIRNDPPLVCNEGSVELPAAGEGGDEDQQAIVNVMYDIFCNHFGYSEEALMGMVACMGVESEVNPNRLESDFKLVSQKEQFDAVAGPGTTPSSDAALQAYWTYGSAFQNQGGWNGNTSGYISDGHMQCGIGLIQWTNDRGKKLLEGLDKVGNDVSPMDISYQCAFLLAEMNTGYTDCAPDSAFAQMTDPVEATKFFFQTMVSGGSLNDVEKRLGCLDGSHNGTNAIELVNNAAANSKFTTDTVSMAEILADDSFSAAVAKTAGIQLCQNKHFIDTSDIAKAAVSISWLERGDYEDVHGAYGEYRRSARSPLLINDWTYEEGYHGTGSDKESHQDGTYGDHGTPSTNPKSSLPYYTEAGGGKLDLIACTEYYYHAHLIAFPRETGRANAGYFSSCDRGTATAVRIAGADDKFPAGNPLAQLAAACGAAKKGAQHDPDKRGNDSSGFLWEFAGFMRGNDYYSASGGNSISPGTVMISWSDDAANGYLNGASLGGATGNSDSGSVFAPDGEGPDGTSPEYEEAATDDKMEEANRRWPFSISNTTRHIITYVGEGTVRNFWGLDWLYQQWTLFDDADRLIRGDLNVELPEIMTKGMGYKAQTASKPGDQKMTFYKAQAEGARDHEDVKISNISGRNTEFNKKTGLPEFKAWEEIFVRLLHDGDDDVAAMTKDGENELYTKFEVDEDNYLDDAADPDLIEQYQGEDTYGNKFFYEDWNSIGAGKDTDGYDEDYKTNLPTSGEDGLLYYDDGTDIWTREKNANNHGYWRYELITDIEYRMNQFMRFGMASLMCSVASEEDADVVQTGGDMTNDAGHILGNLYRRYSRIPDEIDPSGRFYYYNTVVSNDMLQDLVQLYSLERNGDAERNGGGYESRNFGPMMLLGRAEPVGYGYNSQMTHNRWQDRRYGLTATDVENIMNGIGGMSMGMQDNEAADEKLGKFVNLGLHKMSDVELSLYERTQDASTTEVDGAHEGDHEFNTEGYYASEIYGLNPFLMLETNPDNSLEYDLNPGVADHSAATGSTDGVRNSTKGYDGSSSGLDITKDYGDDRLMWIDRHYYQTNSTHGLIGTYAYMVTTMNPSTGKYVNGGLSAYESALKSSKTLETTSADGTFNTNADSQYGSWGIARYTDYIYAESEDENATKSYSMKNRLFGDDDRLDDDNGRDDYNRREWTVIPYYHTHAQMCDHSHHGLLKDHTPNEWFKINKRCQHWDDDAACSDPDIYDIDTILELNKGNSPAEKDVGDTVSFDASVGNRGKYNIQDYLANTTDVHYFVNDGGWREVHPAEQGDCGHEGERPPMHIACPGMDFCPGGGTVDCTACILGPLLGGHSCEESCPIPDCTLGCHHHHDCHELLEKVPDYDHHHTECAENSECHDQYGCNILEYYYHQGKAVYMAIPTVKDPYETMDLSKFVSEYTNGGTCYADQGNLLQLIRYDSNGVVDTAFIGLTDGSTGSTTNPNSHDAVRHIDGRRGRPDASDAVYGVAEKHKSLMPIGCGESRGFGSGIPALRGYFTIEGNLIRESMGDTSSEHITEQSKNCVAEDLQRIEPINIRVGLGKSTYQSVYPGSKVSVSQSSIANDTGLKKLPYSNLKPDDNTTGDIYLGYGEYLVTGAQHQKDPTESQGNYGGLAADNMGGKSGPDGSRGNAKLPDFDSIFRQMLGDEHVAHVTFGSPSAAGLTDKTKDNGRDFMVYVDSKKISNHFDGHGFTKTQQKDAAGNPIPDPNYHPEYYEPAFYMKPGQKCPGCVDAGVSEEEATIIPEFGDDKDVNEQKFNQSLAKSLNCFVDMDADGQYLDPLTDLPTSSAYYDEGAHALSDDPVNEFGTENTPNKYLASSGSLTQTYTDNNGKSHTYEPNENTANPADSDGAVNGGDSKGTGTDGEKTFTDNGDYRLWVAHASRGTRGMMTQYLNFKGFFHDVHADGPNTKEFAYMLFTNIKRDDGPEGSQNADGDKDVKEDFIYHTKPSDATLDIADLNRVWGVGSVEIKDDDGNVLGYKPTNFSDSYGQGANSHWRNMIEVYNAAMSESRQFGN